MKKAFCYDYPRPAVTADIVVVTREARPRVLLIRRRKSPFAGMWALPGGFVDEHEALEAAARRELHEETGLRIARLEQIGAFGAPGRDPRGHTISVAYLGRLDAARVRPCPGDDAADAAWHPLHRLPPLAFDHAEIVTAARRHLRARQ